jgi:hypothetical protein
MTRSGEKSLVWLHGEIQTPPFSKYARVEAGVLLGRLQQGGVLPLPHSRPMPSIGRLAPWWPPAGSVSSPTMS